LGSQAQFFAQPNEGFLTRIKFAGPFPIRTAQQGFDARRGLDAELFFGEGLNPAGPNCLDQHCVVLLRLVAALPRNRRKKRTGSAMSCLAAHFAAMRYGFQRPRSRH